MANLTRSLGATYAPLPQTLGPTLTVVNPVTTVTTGLNTRVGMFVDTGGTLNPIISDTAGNTYTLDRTVTYSWGTFYIWTALNCVPIPAGGYISVTFLNGAGTATLALMVADEFSGEILVSPLDAYAAAQGPPSLAPNSGNTPATVSASEMAWGIIVDGDVAGQPGGTAQNSVIALAGGYTPTLWVSGKNGTGNSYLIQSGYKSLGATGVQNLSGTITPPSGSGVTQYNWLAAVNTYRASIPSSPSGAATGVARAFGKPGGLAGAIGVGVASGNMNLLLASGGTGIGVSLAAVTTTTVIVSAAGRAVGVASARGGNLYSLWNDLGLFWGRMRNLGAFAQTYMSGITGPGFDALKIVNNFSVPGKPDAEGIYVAYQSIGGAFTGFRQSLARFCDARLLDVNNVLKELRLDQSASLDQVLDFLANRMLDESVSLNRSKVTVGPLVPDPSGNIGNGTVLFTTTLDGVAAPGVGFPSHPWYDGKLSELAVAGETMAMICIADSVADGLAEGTESFAWQGAPPNTGLTWDVEGSGQGPALQAAASGTVLAGNDFETWAAGLPSGWNLISGLVNSHLTQDTATFYRGSSAAAFNGDGSTPIVLEQDATVGMIPHRRYCLAVRVLSSSGAFTGAPYVPGGNAIGVASTKGVSGTGSGGQIVGVANMQFAKTAGTAPTITVGFAGTGYTPGAGEQISITANQFPGAWGLYSCWLNVPALIPKDFRIHIEVDGLPAGVQVWLDDVWLKETTYHGGMGAVVIPGSVPFVRGDRFEFSVGNDQAGAFQELFRRRYLTQLPSSNTPTVPDSVCAFP